MFNVKHFFQRALLALSLTGAMALAHASPMSYHVTVNTTSLSNAGFFDASLASSTGAAQGLTANLSNLMGAFTGVDNSVSYSYTTTANGFSLSNAAPNYLSQTADFGSVLSFDVLFSGAFFTGVNGETSNLLFALYDINGAQIGDFGGFNFAASGADRISLLPNSSFITVVANADAAVPEPTALLLMLTAFGVMAVMVKRRQA